MVIYISSDKGSILKKSNLLIRRYERWKCDIRKFIKEEYVNISNMDCEMIVVDVYAIEKVEDILQLKDAFRKSLIVMLIPDDYRGTYPEGIDVLIKDDKTDERLSKLLNPENTKKGNFIKVGIWSDDDKLSIQFAVSLLSFFHKKIDDICLVEISDDFILEKDLKQYKLKDKEGIKYKGISIVHNAMIENCRMGIFTFIKRDTKRPFYMCDIPIEIISEERIKVGNKSYNVSYSSRNYFKRNNTIFYKIFDGYITKKKNSKIKNWLQLIKKQRRKIFFAASIIIALFLLIIPLIAIVSSKNKTHIREITTMVEEVSTEKEFVIEESVTVEKITEEVAIVEETTKEKRIKKKKLINTTSGKKEEKINKKEVITMKRQKNIDFPKQNESGLSGNKRDLIRNSIASKLEGSSETNCKNIAIYMAKYNSSLTDALNKYDVENAGYLFRQTNVVIESEDTDSIISAALLLAENIGNVNCHNYGIGVNSYFSNNRYHIRVVVVYR